MSPRSIASRLAELLGRSRPASPGIRLAYTIETQSDRVTRLAWSRDGAWLAVPSRDGGVRLHEARSGVLVTELEGHVGNAMGVAWAADDRRLASIGSDDELCVWDVARGLLHQSFSCDETGLTGVAWCDGMLVVTSESGWVLRWRDQDARGGSDVGAPELPTLVRDQPFATPGPLHASFAPDGRRLAIGSRDGMVRLWDPFSATLLAELAGHTDASVITAWAPGGTRLSSGAKDGTCRIWDGSLQQAHELLPSRSGEVRAIAWHPGGDLLASKSRAGVALWRPHPWRPVTFIPEAGPALGWSTGLAFHPQLPLLASLGPGDRQVRAWWVDPDELPYDELLADELPADDRVLLAAARPPRRVVIV